MKSPAPPAAVYDVVTAVWGEEFIDLFLAVCVPNQLSPGNLPSLPPGSRYRIFTRHADLERLQRSARLDAVRRLLPVDVVGVDASAVGGDAKPGQMANRYRTMTECHRRAVADAAARPAALIFLAPDFVLGDGTLAALARIHAAGQRAVLSPNLRLARESFVAALVERGIDRPLPPRELVGLALQHLHPSTQTLLVDSPTANEYPGAVCWPVRSAAGALDGLLVRSLSLHPLLLDPVRRDKLPRHTIDGAYLSRSGPPLAQCHVAADSDELVAFELTPVKRVIGNRRHGRALAFLRLAAVAGTDDEYQRSHWRRSIRLHAGDVDARWIEAEAAAGRLVQQVERWRPWSPVLFRLFRRLGRWRQRREAWGRSVRGTLPRRGAAKRALRPARVFLHHVGKRSRLAMKRIRRLRPV